MKDLLVYLYLCQTENKYRAFMTHDAIVDALEFGKGCRVLTVDILCPSIPVGMAYYLLKTVFSREEINGCEIKGSGRRRSPLKRLVDKLTGTGGYRKILRDKYRKVFSVLCDMENLIGKEIIIEAQSYPKTMEIKENLQAEILVQDVCKVSLLDQLRGKQLFLEEIEQVLQEDKALDSSCLSGKELVNYLQVMALRGEIEIVPALTFSGPGELVCNRCGNKSGSTKSYLKVPYAFDEMYAALCPGCRSVTFYCERCKSLGESRLCRPLYLIGERQQTSNLYSPSNNLASAAVESGVTPAVMSPLTPAQNNASKELLSFLKNNKMSECLLWAVTGAGKTEVAAAAIAEVLGAGGVVLYAIPRRDVVRELEPRLKSFFPGVDILTCYGGSAEKLRKSALVIATTHQVLRYYRQFDLVILDEADAYPYKGSDMLRSAVYNAVKNKGKIVILTATPGNEIITRVNSGKAHLITIPVRYHGHPLPEPVLRVEQPFLKKRGGELEVNPYVTDLLQQWVVKEQSQVFVFLPTIKMVDTYSSLLFKRIACLKWGSGIRHMFSSHSKDQDRDKKIESFKKGDCRILVTTTIMERGFTVKRANVLVLEADYEKIFDDGTLIQMAGRSGRSAEFPMGQVVFAGKTISSSMTRARDKIRDLNNYARLQGYLKKEV